MYINKNIFKFLQFRETVLDVNELELQYKIQLPPIYKSFISVFSPYFSDLLFDAGGEKIESFTTIIMPKEKKELYNFNDDILAFNSFLNPEKVLKFEAKYDGWEEDLLYIADHGYHGGLMVGIKGDKIDKIYHSADTMQIDFVANNIYELIQRMEVVFVDFAFPDLDLTKLYRNFDEDFWRIKEDNNPTT